MPTYNGQTYLRDCLESALNQTFTDIEVLIVDDGSTDDTPSIIEEFRRDDGRVIVHKNEINLGLVGNWNRCVALAKGSWIKFLFQDDFLDRCCIERMLPGQGDEWPLVICRRDVVCEDDVADEDKAKFLEFVRDNSLAQRFPSRELISAEDFTDRFLQDPTHNWIGEPAAALIHRGVFDRVGNFNNALVSLCDWEFFARVAVHNGLRIVDDSLATFRVHGRSTSGQQRATQAYRALYIDPIIIRHDMTYHETYQPLRTRAAKFGGLDSLIQQLLYAVRDARLYAENRAYDPMHPDPQPLAEWFKARQQFPKMNIVPWTYTVNWAKRRGRQFLGLGSVSATRQT